MIQGFSSSLLGNRELIYETDLPSFQRDFASLKTLDHGYGPSITFTRASNATFFDVDGVLQTAGNNVPRFDHDPADGGKSLGLLIEEARTNLLERSAEFDNAYWTTDAASISANSESAPSGSSSGDKLVEDATNAQHRVRRTGITHGGAASTVTATVFAKAAERSRLQIDVYAISGSDGTGGRATFNVGDGTVGAFFGISVGSGSAGTGSATITSVGNGWYRCALTVTPAAGITPTSNQVYFALNDGTSSTYTGNGTSGLYIWGAQLEAGAFATSYIPTTTAAATRSADSAVVTPISSFYNQSEGTLFAEAIASTVTGVGSGGASQHVAALIENISGNVYVGLYRQTSATNGRLFVGTSGGTQADISQSGFVSGASTKLIGALRQDDIALSVNGASTSTDTTALLPSPTSLRIGGLLTTGFLNGHIRKIAYWPKRLSNTLLEQLTT